VRAAEARAREQRSSRGGFGSSLSASSMASRTPSLVNKQQQRPNLLPRGPEAAAPGSPPLRARGGGEVKHRRWPGAARPRPTWRRSRWRGRRSCRTQRSGRNWTGASAGASGSVLPVAGSARFCRRVRVQGNRPRASRLKARGTGAERERRTRAAARRGGPAGGCADMLAVHAQEQSGRRGFLLVRAGAFCRPCFSSTRA
jgi:hypothetical protein